MHPGSTPPPGWYPDPAGSGSARWWTGSSWGEATAPVPPAAAPVPPPAAFVPPGPAPGSGSGATWHLNREGGFVSWGQRALAGYTILELVSLINLLHYRLAVHRIFEYFIHTVAHAHGSTLPPVPMAPPGYTLTSDLCVVGLVGGIVVMLMWQHRAATTARFLGLPARRSPAWGVGCWFVPVVNLWFPYESLRDCFPPGDPNRRRVLAFWLFLLAALVGNGSAFLLVVNQPGAGGYAGLALAAALWAGVASSGWRMMRGIHEAHTAIVDPPSSPSGFPSFT